MDEHYLEHPYKGVPMMHAWLRSQGYKVNIKRIARLFYEIMGLRAVAPGKHTTKRNPKHKAYPYLLHNLKIQRANQVWATDITYIPMAKGFMYLTAIIDLHSRYVVNWSVNNTMDADWCVDVLKEAIELHGLPEIVNTDQGSQYTSEAFSNYVLSQQIKLSMDGKGRATDNAFIERLWRSVKYEKIYLNPPKDGLDLSLQMADYFQYYNNERHHSSLNYKTPSKFYPNQATSVENHVLMNTNAYLLTKKKGAKKKKKDSAATEIVLS
jgi:putative transposase